MKVAINIKKASNKTKSTSVSENNGFNTLYMIITFSESFKFELI
ncbi:MAG: hypothetical protein ACRC6T_00260 [Sarcina sp.]